MEVSCLSNRRLLLSASLVLTLILTLAGAALAQVSGEVEIFSWWAGDEGPALEAIVAEFERLHPGAHINNATVTGGAGVAAKAVLKTRMLGGDAPGSFQVHAGQELIGTWVIAQRMEDLTFLFDEQGWHDVFPQTLIDLSSTADGIWSVPVNVHRSNVMWYIPENLQRWGVDVPKTWDEFLAIAPALEAQGVLPLSMGENWTATHLWESVAMAKLGPEKWQALWDGELAFTDPEAVAVWNLFGEIVGYTNADAASLSWQQATDLVVNGDAAFNIMGDWAAGYMSTTLGLEPGTGFAWAASPGTDGVFMMLSDAFGLPVGAPNRDGVLAWLRFVGTREAQDIFNPLKGSISPRLDSDLSKYDAYGQSAARDWQTNVLAGSLAHGVTASEQFMNDFATAMEIFLSTGNSMAAANAAQAIAIQSGIGR